MSLKTLTGIELLIVVLILALVGGFCWTYTINTWLLFLGKVAILKFWQGMILGVLLNGLTIPATVITWILMLFL